MTMIRTVTVDGPISNPKPMNPASTVYRDHNPNLIVITGHRWQPIDVAGDAEKWRKQWENRP